MGSSLWSCGKAIAELNKIGQGFNMSNEMFEELERVMNEELKKNGFDMKIEVKGFKNGGFLINIPRELSGTDEIRRYNEATGNAWNKLRKKWLKEF